jgi:DMSO/TMAO reductase YedYZ molybdopterin-dependent catalytic subunit
MHTNKISPNKISRRELFQYSGAALTGMSLLSGMSLAQTASAQSADEVLPWIDQPAENPVPQILADPLHWEDLDSWYTPSDQFCSVSHYNRPEIDASTWQLEVSGLVGNPLTLTLDDLKTWPRQELDFTLERSGNHGLPFLWGGIGNARWGGTSLAAILGEPTFSTRGSKSSFGAQMPVRRRSGSRLSRRILRAPCRSKMR